MTVCVYSDAGVSPIMLQYTLEALEESIPRMHSLHTVKHTFFLKNNWEEKVSLLVFPGGRDTPYQERLRGEANCRIKKFVELGGAYFGICAGAYFGAASFEFEKGKDLQIVAERDLKFFPGKAIGSAYGKGIFQYGSEIGFRMASIGWKKEDVSSIYFNGGCFFEDPLAFEGVKILGRYEDLPLKPAAIVLCSVGQGKALLSGVHPEFPLKPPEKDHQRKSLFNHLISLIIS